MNMNNNQQDGNKKFFENFPFLNAQNNPLPNFDMNFLPKQNFLYPLMRNSNDQNWMNQMQMKNHPKAEESENK